MTTLLILYVCAGTLLCALSVPLILQKVKPNPWYGFRVRQTLEDPALWYKVNSYAGKRLLAAGIITVLASIGFSRIPEIGVDAYALACVAVFGVVLIAGLVQSLLFMRRCESLAGTKESDHGN